MPLAEAPDHSLAQRIAARLPFFYGWVVVSVSALCLFMWGAVSFWGVPLFARPMTEDTGWSNTTIFAGLSLYFLSGSLGGLLFGRMMDKPGGGARLLAGSVLVSGSSLIVLRWVDSPVQFLLVYGVIGGLGSSGLRLVQATLLSKWFVAGRGKAAGFVGNGGSASALIMVPIIAVLLSEFGWRDTWALLGVLLMVTMLPLVPLLVRQPEDMGLLPDNGIAGSARRSAAAEESYTLKEAWATPQFWILLGGMLIGYFGLQMHTVIMAPHAENLGFSSGQAARALSIYGMTSLAVRFAWGYLADRQDVRVTIIVQSVLTALGALLLMRVGSPLSLYLIIGFQGMVLSGFNPLQVLVWPEYFGRRYIGSIVGFTQLVTTFIGALAPVIVGLLLDSTGSHQTGLWALVAIWLACALTVATVKPLVQRKSPPVAAENQAT